MSPAPRGFMNYTCTCVRTYVFPPARPMGLFPIKQKVILKSCLLSISCPSSLVYAYLLAQHNGRGMRGVYLRFIPSSEGQRKLVPKLEGHVSTYDQIYVLMASSHAPFLCCRSFCQLSLIMTSWSKSRRVPSAKSTPK